MLSCIKLFVKEESTTMLEKEKQSILEEDILDHKKPNYLKDIIEMILYFIVVAAIVSFIYTFVGQHVEVSGMSMESTLHDSDHLILEKLTYHFQEPKRYDIIVFKPYVENNDLFYIKRIIGLPGETVQIIGSDIYINGDKLDENYGNQDILDGGIAKEEIILNDDEYFVLGDNRNNSKDSRFSDVGNVHKDAILGRGWARIWPLNSIEFLKHQ